MASDVTLDGDLVTVDGGWARLRAHDLMLDSPGRRLEQSGARRALVRDPSGRLTVNYKGDYPNGVRIGGNTSIQALYVEGTAGFAPGIVAPSLTPGSPPPSAPCVPGGPPGGSGAWGRDTGGALQRLEAEIADSRQRVAALEGPSETTDPGTPLEPRHEEGGSHDAHPTR